MSYSAQTEKLRLPQWVQGSKDHPDFLTDVNQAFEKIDGFAQGIDNTVDGLPEQVEEVATILQSVQEDVGEHTSKIASQGVRIGILETGMAEVNGLDSRVAALEDGQSVQDEKIDAMDEIDIKISGYRTVHVSGHPYPITLQHATNPNVSVEINGIQKIGNILRIEPNNGNLPDDIRYAHIDVPEDIANAISQGVSDVSDGFIMENGIDGYLNGKDGSGRAFRFGVAYAIAENYKLKGIQLFQYPGAAALRGSDKTLHGTAILTVIRRNDA